MASVKTITRKLNAWRLRREAIRALAQMSDRELSDIAVARGDIEFAVRHARAV
ncbi:MAG: DUF1127 domain-containing protein [Roseiarcus sp.]|jgi:uncharacterized protein YjiS (DUF1127 family)